MTAPILPDVTRVTPKPPERNDVRRLMDLIAQAQQAGYSREEISARLQADRGISLDDFERQTKVSPANVGRAAGMGATLGFLDEAAGAISATKGLVPPALLPALPLVSQITRLLSPAANERYLAARNSVREPYESFRGAHPVVSGASEVAGGMLLPGGAARTAATSGGGLLRAGLQAGRSGAVAGGLAGAGYAPELEDVPMQSVVGAAGGGLLGLGLGVGGQAATNAVRGGAASRLDRAIQAGGGEDALRRSASEATEAGRGRVQPVGALSPYLRGEAEFAATRSPSVFGQYGPKTARARAGDAERLIRDVTDITGAPAVGREGLVAARQQQFGPVYRALEESATPLSPEHTKDVLGILQRPYVKNAYQEAVNEGLLAGENAAQPGFKALNNLRQHLRSSQERAFTAGDGARGAAFRQAADDLEGLLENAVPEFRAVQNAYRDASRPVNIIDLARLETARQGRASPALDRASRELRRDLLQAFGSSEKYRAFMKRVAQEGDLAQFNAQVFGNSATARRQLSDMGVQPEDVVQAATQPSGIVSQIAGRVVPSAVRERAARQMAPMLFAPANQIDDVIQRLRALRTKQSAGPFVRGTVPVAGGLLFGR